MKETRFKQTEVGMIPSDWDVVNLSDVAEMSSGTTPSRFNEKNFKGDVCWISSGELKSHYIYDTKEKISKSAASSMRLYPKGTVVIAMYGLEAEGVRGTSSILAKECTISQACMAFTNLKGIDNEFFYYWYAVNGDEIGTKYAQGTKQQNLSPEVMKNVKIPLPPTIEEQQRIANALSDVDSLIANLEKLIAKKKNIKQGAMQQLLTGRKRLPAFAPAKPTYKQTELGPIPADWDVKSFSDVFEILPNNTLARADLNENKGSFRDVHYGDVLVQFGEWIDCEKVSLPFINCNVRFNKTTLKNGDVVIADTAEDETVGKATEIFNADNQSVVSGLHTIPVRPKFEFAAKWLGYYMNSACWHDQILPFITGTKVSAISKAAVAQTKLFYPQKKEEQTAIANILSDMDSEIQTLETKLAKYRKLKTGMMQQLLTGKIRLV